MIDSFVSDIIENPDDLSIRLIFSDYLIEQEDKDLVKYGNFMKENINNPVLQPAFSEDLDLTLYNRAGWLKYYFPGDLALSCIPMNARHNFRRFHEVWINGCVELLCLPVWSWFRHASEILEKNPIKRVYFTDFSEIKLFEDGFFINDKYFPGKSICSICLEKWPKIWFSPTLLHTILNPKVFFENLARRRNV